MSGLDRGQGTAEAEVSPVLGLDLSVSASDWYVLGLGYPSASDSQSYYISLLVIWNIKTVRRCP